MIFYVCYAEEALRIEINLFFECPFLKDFGGKLGNGLIKIGLMKTSIILSIVLQQIGKGKRLSADCSILGFNACVYHIWVQRNAIKCLGTIKTEDQIAGLIRKQVKARIESKGPYPRSSINTKICIRWGISDVVFKSKDLIGKAEFWLALYYLLVN